MQYCLLNLQKTSKDLWLWLVCTFGLEQKILLFAVYDLLLTLNFIKDLYIHLLLGKFF